MSRYSAVNRLFSNASPSKVVVKKQGQPAQAPKTALELEVERLRAENAALKSQPKARPSASTREIPVEIPVEITFVNVEGTECVRITGPFKPFWLSRAKFNLVKGNLSKIERLFA